MTSSISRLEKRKYAWIGYIVHNYSTPWHSYDIRFIADVTCFTIIHSVAIDDSSVLSSLQFQANPPLDFSHACATMSLVLSKSPCSSHRATKTFEALGTSLIVVLGFLVSTETKIVLSRQWERATLQWNLCFNISISFCSYNHDSFYREVNLLMRQI